MIIKRQIQESIEKDLFKNKIIIIYGARRVGKTTLVNEIIKKFLNESVYFNCDEPDIRENLTNKTSTALKAFIGNKKLVIIDEAQRVQNIGLTLKLLIDNYPDTQIIATGSSSFDLSNQIAEPLTGRNIEYKLYPLSLAELSQIYSNLELDRLLERQIIFGMYPSIIQGTGDTERDLKSLAISYSYKDILQYQNIKNPDLLEKLLQALALQIGQEVSYGEIANLIGIDQKTVAHYVDILEKSFIIFRLRPFSRNLRNELKKLRKIYFFDNGIRNALINNFNNINLRQDVGALWENFMISERIKYNYNNNLNKNIYFWRTAQRQELDYLEESANTLTAFEFKWQKEKFKIPKIFIENYPESEIKMINRDNYKDFLIKN